MPIRDSRATTLKLMKSLLLKLNVDEIEEVDRECFRLRLDLLTRRAEHWQIDPVYGKLKDSLPELPEEKDEDIKIGKRLDVTG